MGVDNLFYCDLQAGTIRALTTNGVASAAMTSDGRWVAFVGALGTLSTNLYVWDAQSATRVYTNTVSGASMVTISRDGNRLAYATSSLLYVVDRRTNTTWSVGPMAPSCRIGMAFSADGRFLTYASTTAQMLVDTNNTYDVYLYDTQSSTKLLVSQSYGSAAAANDASDCPDISPDGRFIAYRSVASNIVPGDANGVGDVFVFDRATGKTSLLSLSRGGEGSADSWSFRPQFTGGGRQVLFESWASDLVGYDFNQGSDVFAYVLFFADIVRAPAAWQSPTLSWPALPGKIYSIQFRANLKSGSWLEAGGTVTVVGDTAYFTDPASPATQRFYRIVSN
jgi:Tol biopolymer transport system component